MGPHVPLWGPICVPMCPYGVPMGSLRPTALPPELLPLLAAMLDPDPQRRPTAEALLQSAPMRRVGRWRPLLRLLDVGLRRGAELLQVSAP